MSQQEKVKFIVKNGRYAGSVIELEPDQEYSLGRSFHCDIAIDDPRFAERQMLLNVTQDGVQIKLLAEGKLAVNGDAKDTNAQSEWRHMDPRSSFVMNDLEFSFEVPSLLLSEYEQRARAPELEVETQGYSQSQSQSHSQSHSQSRASSKRSDSQGIVDHQEFEELETQVPSQGERDDDPQDEEGHVPTNLADRLDFDTSSGPKYTRSNRPLRSEKEEEKHKPLLLWGSVAAGLVVFLGIYWFVGPRDTNPTFDADSMAESSDSDNPIEFEEPVSLNRESELSPFSLPGNGDVIGGEMSFTDPQAQDPFTAYDQAQEQKKASTLQEPSDPADQLQSPEDFAENTPDQPLQSTQTQSELAKVSDKKTASSDKDPQTATKDQVPAAKDDDTTAAIINTPGLSFGQLNGDASRAQYPQESAKATQEQPKEQAAEGSKPSKPVANNDGVASSEGIWAVMKGDAPPKTIAVQTTRDLLSGLALGNLAVTLRPPKKVNGVMEEEPVVVVTGYVPDRRSWMRAKDIIGHDLKSIGTLVDNVASPEVRKAQLERWISKSDLEGKVATYLSERGLIAKVNLNPSQVGVWEKIARRYVDTFDNTPELFVMRDPGDWLQIRSISFGARPHLVTSDGAVLAPGAKLSNGYSIVAIRPSGVELKDQFGSYTYVF